MSNVKIFDQPPAALPLMLKAAAGSIPIISGLPGIAHQRGNTPSMRLLRPQVRTEMAHLQQYREVCGFDRADTLPVTYPHLAAFGLHMSLMTDSSFPFTPMGLVHLRNTITQHRPIGIDEIYDVSVRAENLRAHPKGQLIDVITDIEVAGDQVWTETMTLFARGRGADPKASAQTDPRQSELENLQPPSGAVRWRLPGSLGREYGAVSGDRNPIHLYPFTAKPFGFSSNIAHGMWTKARSLAALQNRLGDSFSVQVEFKRPVLLPATVIFGSDISDTGIDFGLTGAKQQIHLVGRITR